MSTLVTNKLINPVDGNVLYSSPQAVVQVVTVRMDTITATTSAGWTELGGGNFRLTITPKFSNSRLIIRFSPYGEFGDHNSLFRLYRDGAVIATAGEQGYNSTAGTSNWSGYFMDFYDQDTNSTANKYCLLYSQIAGSTASRYYSIYFLGSDGGNRTWYQNRTVGSAGQNAYENGVSVGHVIEVAQ